MKLTLGFSPCPNDTFIFDALVNQKIDTGDLSFEVVMEDVQTLNQVAIAGKLDLSKISYGVLPLLLEEYHVLDAGGALGMGVGPLLISRTPVEPNETIDTKTIAIPGEHTTAHLLFSLAYPYAPQKKFMIFSQIEEAVLNGEVDLGVIIHENRFTYMQRGLFKVVDLGDYWEKETHGPIPLGGIVIRRNLSDVLTQKIDGLIRQSITYAFNNYPALSVYVKAHSQEMEEKVMRQHIDLYVNNYSLALGTAGKVAVKKLLDVYRQQHRRSTPVTNNIFAING